MSDENTTAVAETEVAEPQLPDTELTIDVGGVPLTVIETTHKKGKTKGQVAYYVKVNLEDEAPFAGIMQAVGRENFNRCIMAQVVRPACNDATADALKNGEVSDVDWANMFREQFLPSTRRSGVGVKELREKQAELFAELNPLLLQQAHGEKLNEQDQNRLLALLADYGDLNEKIEKRSRKGKKGEKGEKGEKKPAA